MPSPSTLFLSRLFLVDACHQHCGSHLLRRLDRSASATPGPPCSTPACQALISVSHRLETRLQRVVCAPQTRPSTAISSPPLRFGSLIRGDIFPLLLPSRWSLHLSFFLRGRLFRLSHLSTARPSFGVMSGPCSCLRPGGLHLCLPVCRNRRPCGFQHCSGALHAAPTSH